MSAKRSSVIEGHPFPDHVHLCLSLLLKYCVASIVGFLKGNSAIRLNKEFSKAKSTGKHFWIRGYFVSTMGLNEEAEHNALRAKKQNV